MITREVCLLTVALAFLSVAVSKVSAQGTSTPEERAQWVEVTHKLENAPLDESVNKQGESALQQITDAHDIHVPLCPGLLSEFDGLKYVYSHAITRQYMLASTAFLVENSGKAGNSDSMNLTAVESVLKTYDAILQQKPEAKSKTLDDLLKKQSQGKLKESVQKLCH